MNLHIKIGGSLQVSMLNREFMLFNYALKGSDKSCLFSN